MKKKMVESALSETPRDRIFSTIVKNPGLHFREIQRRTGDATGALQYHIDYLKKKNFIREEKEGKFSRYYSTEEKNTNTKLMNLLRQDQVRIIVLLLIDRRRATINVISETCKMTPSTASFHIKKLIKEGIVKEEKVKDNVFYSIPEKEPLMELLIIHKKSFLDKLVDNFVSIWEEELSREFEN
jgi:predicted transcriptional regulator